MNPNFILPDSIGCLLLVFGAIAIVVYLKATIDDIKAARRERAVRELEVTVKHLIDDIRMARLVDYYKAAAYGDPEDFDYWEETARKFM